MELNSTAVSPICLQDNMTIAGANATTETDPALSLFNYVVNVYIDGLLCLLGYIGNISILIVLHKDAVRTSNAIFLQALAIFDSMFLTYVLLYVVLRTLASYTGALQGYTAINSYIVAIVLPIGWTSQTCTIWLVMVIAIDRYIAVSRPLKATLWCTTKNAKRVVVIVFVAAVLFNAPRWPHYYYVGFISGKNKSGGTTFISHLVFDVNFWNEDLYSKIYHITLTFVFLFIIPLTIIIVLNVRLALAIKAAMRKRQQMTNSVRPGGASQKVDSSTNVNLMLVIVISIFVICELPDFIAAIVGAMDAKSHLTGYGYFAAVKESLLVLNSAINFYIYCIFYKRFNKTLSTTIRGCFSKPHQEATVKVVDNSVSVVSSVGSQHTVDSDVGQFRYNPDKYFQTSRQIFIARL